MRLRILVFCFCLWGAGSQAAKILAVFPVQSPSHYILVQPLLKELAGRGHEITAVTPYPQEVPINNFRDIVVLKDFKYIADHVQDNQDLRDMSLQKFFHLHYAVGTATSRSILQQPEIEGLLAARNETFDLVIIDICADEALFGFAAHFRSSLVGVAPFGAHFWNTDLTGTPTLPAFTPHYLLSNSEEMSFFERVQNFYVHFADYIFYNFKYLPALDQIFGEHFAHTGRTLADMRRNFSLVLLNQHSSLGAVRPYVPNMIEVGGMQVSPRHNPLPAEMQEFLDGAAAGAIYFSLGSNVRSENIPPAKLNDILSTFRALPQRILWKLDAANLSSLPANVHVSSWLPQSDVLAHPNVRLFITHGGLLSTTEAVVRGKPLLGIPMFFDQHLNMRRARRLGFALTLDYNELSGARLAAAIQELLSNASYARAAEVVSRRYHDKPQTALQTAVFWVEYVLRHRGAHHLRCAGLNLNVWQYYGLDVLALTLVVTLLGLALIAFGLRKLSLLSARAVKTEGVARKAKML